MLEIGIALSARLFNLKINLPTYSWHNSQGFWYDLDPTFGTKHLANDEYRQKKSCFDVNYFSNTEGFRDRPRTQSSMQFRAMVIGDSFVEGFGVDTAFRFSNVLEKQTGIEHLNFGMSGNFSPSQYWLLYKEIKDQYDHDLLIVNLLPSNDLIDDDPKYASVDDSRYKPYLIEDSSGYSIRYFCNDLKKSKALPTAANVTKKVLANYTNTYHAYHYLKTVLSLFQMRGQVTNLPGYWSTSDEEWKRLKHCLVQIKALAKKKPVLVICSPSLSELNGIGERESSRLSDSLSQLSKGINFHFLDLLKSWKDLDQENKNSFYLPCDGHWSESGHYEVARQIGQQLKHIYPKKNEQ